MAHLGKLSFVAAVFLAFTCVTPGATAAEPPADLCSLLPAADVSKTLGQAYASPEKSVAPRPFPNTNTGTDCKYRPSGSGNTLLFRAYVDPSASSAADLFAKLRNFFGPPTAIAGLGDEAYSDEGHGLHVRKGKVRFFLSFGITGSITPANDKQLKDLASLVAGRI